MNHDPIGGIFHKGWKAKDEARLMHTGTKRSREMVKASLLLIALMFGVRPTRVNALDHKEQRTLLTENSARRRDQYAKLPMSFVVNQGQNAKEVKFVARGGGYSLFLTGKGAVLSLHKATASTSANKPARFTAHGVSLQATGENEPAVQARSAAQSSETAVQIGRAPV